MIVLEKVFDAAAPQGAFTERLIGSRELFKLVAFHRGTLRAKIKAGEFPAPAVHGTVKSKRLWRYSEVEAYLKGEWPARK